MRVVAKMKRKKEIMSFTISITIRRSTRVLLKSENTENTFTLWKSVRRVRKRGLAGLEGESATATAKYKKEKKKRRTSNQFHRS